MKVLQSWENVAADERPPRSGRPFLSAGSARLPLAKMTMFLARRGNDSSVAIAGRTSELQFSGVDFKARAVDFGSDRVAERKVYESMPILWTTANSV